MNVRISLIIGLTTFMLGCGASSSVEEQEGYGHDALLELPWDSVLAQARHQEVTLMMWQGDPLINAYMREYVAPEVFRRYGITLNIASGQGSQIVSTLLAETQAGVDESDIDLMWINGETFYQLRQMDALYGPFVQALPNSRYIDLSNPFISTDFQQPIGGFECPWGNVQLCIIYNSDQITQPPTTPEALEEFVRTHPGSFTLSTDFTGMTLLKSLMVALEGDPQILNGPFNEEKYQRLSSALWHYLNRLKPYFWKEGKTFPNSVATMHQLYSNGELLFTMSNNDGEVENKVLNGTLPEFSRAFVFESGTIQNSHYIGLTAHSAKKAAAMAVINFLISPEAQLKKADPKVWGDGSVLDRSLLTSEQQEAFDALDDRMFAPLRSEIDSKAIQEPAPEYMIRLHQDFRRYVIEK